MSTPDNRVLLQLPDAAEAPGIRDGIRERARWRLLEVTPGSGAIEPNEGAGSVFPYFKVHKLCDAHTALTDETWEPVRRAPAWSKDDIPPPRTSPGGAGNPAWRELLESWIARLER